MENDHLNMLDAILGAGFMIRFEHIQAPWDAEYKEAVGISLITKGGFVVYRTIQVYASDAIELAYHWVNNRET